MNRLFFKRAISMASQTPIEDTIRQRLIDTFKPSVLTITNDSHLHAHHAGIRGSTNKTESHFTIYIVSENFKGKLQPARHRAIYSLLDDKLKMENGIHALSLKTKTPEEVARTIAKD